MLLPLLCSGISMTFTNAFYIETIFEMASNFYPIGNATPDNRAHSEMYFSCTRARIGADPSPLLASGAFCYHEPTVIREFTLSPTVIRQFAVSSIRLAFDWRSWRAGMKALRMPSLVIAGFSCALGVVLAYHDGRGDLINAAAVLVAGLALQAGVNLVNDFFEVPPEAGSTTSWPTSLLARRIASSWSGSSSW